MNPNSRNERLKRRAIVYLRQSSPEQVFHNPEVNDGNMVWPTKHATSVFRTSW